VPIERSRPASTSCSPGVDSIRFVLLIRGGARFCSSSEREATEVLQRLGLDQIFGLRCDGELDASLATRLLLVAKVLGLYKPRGLTAYGRRKQREQHMVMQP
jgi:hypothetical protein